MLRLKESTTQYFILFSCISLVCILYTLLNHYAQTTLLTTERLPWIWTRVIDFEVFKTWHFIDQCYFTRHGQYKCNYVAILSMSELGPSAIFWQTLSPSFYMREDIALFFAPVHDLVYYTRNLEWSDGCWVDLIQTWLILIKLIVYPFFFIVIFIKHLVVFLLLTLVIATITLMERKLLSLVQRRVGPNYIGYRGRLQFIADAGKLVVKHITILTGWNRLLGLVTPACTLIICYLFWLNLVWGPNLAICELEYNLLFMGILSLIFSFLLFLVGWVSKNKYAVLSSNRVLVILLNLEIFLNFFLLCLLALYESFSFVQIVSFQASNLWSIYIFLPILPLIFITFLLETGRIPFDLGEAESELIAGYTTEMGGFFFALFYLGEYFHLFCFSLVYTLCLFGGWF